MSIAIWVVLLVATITLLLTISKKKKDLVKNRKQSLRQLI